MAGKGQSVVMLPISLTCMCVVNTATFFFERHAKYDTVGLKIFRGKIQAEILQMIAKMLYGSEDSLTKNFPLDTAGGCQTLHPL